MVISFSLGDSLKEALLNLGIDKNEAKRVINEFETSLEKEIKKEVKNEVASSLKDLPTRDEVNQKFEQIDKKFEKVDKRFEKLESKLDKFLYVVLGFMFSLVGGSLLLLFRFGNFN